MIAKPSIAFNDFAGTAKEVTARNVNGRNVLSVRAKQSKVVTPSQAISRNQLSKVSRAYKQLSDSQMAAWAALAEHLKGISTFGLAAEMTAHNAFVRINENRSMVGMSLLSDAPEYISDVPEVEYEDVWVTQRRTVITGIVSPNPNYRLIVKMSTGLSVGISNGWSKTVIVMPGGIDDWGDANVTYLYNKTIGFAPRVGDKVFIEFWWMDRTTGFTGEAMRLTRICLTDQEAEEQGYVARNNFTMADIDTNKSHVSEFNLDLGTGINAMAVDAKLLGHSNVASSYVVLDKKLNYTWQNFFIMLGRSAGNGKVNAQSIQGQFGTEDSKTSITFAHRGGSYAKPTEIFGPALLFK